MNQILFIDIVVIRMSKLDMNTTYFGSESLDKQVLVFYDRSQPLGSVMFGHYNLHFDDLTSEWPLSASQLEELKTDPFFRFGRSIITTISTDATCLPLCKFEASEEDPPTQFSRWFVHTLAASKLTDEQIGGLQRQFAALFRSRERFSATYTITSRQMLYMSLGFCAAHPQHQLTSDVGLQTALTSLFVKAETRGALVAFTGELLELFYQGKVWPMVVNGEFHLRALVDASTHQVLFGEVRVNPTTEHSKAPEESKAEIGEEKEENEEKKEEKEEGIATQEGSVSGTGDVVSFAHPATSALSGSAGNATSDAEMYEWESEAESDTSYFGSLVLSDESV